MGTSIFRWQAKDISRLTTMRACSVALGEAEMNPAEARPFLEIMPIERDQTPKHLLGLHSPLTGWFEGYSMPTKRPVFLHIV